MMHAEVPKPTITNVSMFDISKLDAGYSEDDILIQIVDPGLTFPEPKFNFKHVHQFEFNDDDPESIHLPTTVFFNAEMAEQVANILTEAYAANRNVVVHCVAGLCRSGAVVEVGVMMGFRALHSNRQPNSWVKRKLIEALGYGY